MLFKDQSFEKMDSYILAICFLCIFASSSWLIYDLTFTSYDLKGNTPIGKISKVSNHVKRKFNRSLIWYDANQKETVFENDWVFTGSNSQATILFDDGGELTVDPDSLIILARENGTLKLNLQHGSMLANVSPNVKINVLKDGKLKQIANTNKRILSKKKAPPVKRAAKKIESNIFLKKPSDFETLWVNKEQSIHFLWDSEPLVKKYKFELSQNKEFTSPIAKTYTKNNVNLKLRSSQTFYWRVSDKENPKSQSTVNRFNVKFNIPPLPTLSLKEGEVLTVTKKNGKIPSVELPWKDTYNSWDKFDVQIANDPEFSNILTEQSTEKKLYLFNVKTNGTYYWRVRGQDKDGDIISDWSEKQPLGISIKDDVKKEIFLSQKNITIDVNESDYEKITDSNIIKKAFKVTWSANFKPSSFRVQISKDKNFTENYEDSLSSKKYISFKSIPIGVSFYRVLAENAQGKTELTSSQGQIITYFSQPKNLNNEISEDKHKLNWSSLPGISLYQVNYTDQKDAAPQDSFSSEAQLELPNNNQFLEWKVRAVDTVTKTPLSDWSDGVLSTPPEKKLASVKKPENAKVFPIITSPTTRKTFVAIGKNPIFIVMKWIYKSSADSFDVEVSTNPNMDNIIYKRKVYKKKRAVINQTFTPGKYYMRVRAIEDNSAKAWSNVEVFRVKAP